MTERENCIRDLQEKAGYCYCMPYKSGRMQYHTTLGNMQVRFITKYEHNSNDSRWIDTSNKLQKWLHLRPS